MFFGDDHATGEGAVDEVGERLFRPFRFRESIGVTRNLNKVPIYALLPTACGLSPQGFPPFTPRNIVSVPGVVQVPGRNATEEEQVVRLAR